MNTRTVQHDLFKYAFQDVPDQQTVNLLGETPTRWGRMPVLSRILVVETGRFLRKNQLIDNIRSLSETGNNVGLIGGTARGSLTVDLAFANTLKQGAELASPALFGYTLANTPLAEAANHYGLIGPVFAIIDNDNPLQNAVAECRRFLNDSEKIDYMLACCFDDSCPDSDKQLQLTFSLIERT